jgi:TDG/mug DNA glycosylase family protein
MGRSRSKAFGKTLPDYLAPGLNTVFVGLNPGRYSVEAGHYFARPQNRFWSALFASGLVTHSVSPEDDASLLQQGIGFTDLIKRPTRSIDELSRDEYKTGAEVLRRKLIRFQPKVACFVGLTGYKICFNPHAIIGLQAEQLGRTDLFVIPSTSSRNARYSLDDVTRCLNELQQVLNKDR